MQDSTWLLIIGIGGTVITSMAAFIFVSFKNGTREKFLDLYNKWESQSKEIHKIDRRLYEYQLAAGAAFLLKDDFKEFKDGIGKVKK